MAKILTILIQISMKFLTYISLAKNKSFNEQELVNELMKNFPDQLDANKLVG